MNKLRRLGIAAVCVLIAMAAAVYLAWPVFNPTPWQYDEQIGEATIAIQVDRDTVFFAGDCFHVSWQIDRIQAVYVQGVGTTGVDERTFCQVSANFRIMLVDGTPHDVVIAPDVLLREAATTPLIGLIALSTLMLLGALGGFFGPQRWLDDSRHFVRDARALWRDIRHSPRAHLWCLGGIIVIGVGLRLILMPRELTIDEVESYNSYTFNWWQAIASYDDPNNHLLNTAFMFVNSRLFGASEVALRLHAFVFGVLALPLAYIFGRVYYNPQVGLGAAAIMAGANVMVEYSAMARGYGLQTTLFLIMLILAYHIIRKDNALSWFLFALVTPLAFYALPTAVYLYFGFGIWMLLTILFGKDRWQRIGHWIAYTTLAGWLTIFLYLPTLVTLGLRLIIANGYVARRGLEPFMYNVANWLPDVFGLWNLSVPITALLSIGCVLGVVWHRRMAAHRFPLLLTMLIPIWLVVIVQQTVPLERSWTFMFPIFAATAAAGWLALWQHWAFEVPAHWARRMGCGLAIALTLATGVYGLASKWERYSSDEYHNMIAYFEANLRDPATDRILSYPPVSETLFYYFGRYGIPLDYLSRTVDDSYHFYMASAKVHVPDFVLSYYDGLSVDPSDFAVVWEQDRLWIHTQQAEAE